MVQARFQVPALWDAAPPLCWLRWCLKIVRPKRRPEASHSARARGCSPVKPPPRVSGGAARPIVAVLALEPAAPRAWRRFLLLHRGSHGR
jgi:hypothetical protein